jgi:RimJ/RimL family protein N-acetyltransferase
MNVVYTGERVRLRPFKDEAECVEVRKQINMTPNDVWGCSWRPVSKLKEGFEKAGLIDATEQSMFAVERLDTGECIGYEVFGVPTPGRPCGSVGTMLLSAHWHKGFGLEAKQLCYCFLFENLALSRIDASTVASHKRAAEGLHKSGMHFEGRIRRCYLSQGKYRDLVFYAIFREEWEKLPIRQIVKRG